MALITLGAGLLRLALMSRSVWFDEAGSVRVLGGTAAQLWHFTVHDEVTPPLYMLALWIWGHLVGDGITSLRLLSVLVGTAVVPVAYLGGARLFDRRVGWIAALLTATCSTLIYHAQEIRSYAFLMLFSGLAFLAFLDVLADPQARGPLKRWTVFSVLALLSHYWAWLAIAPQVCVLVVELRENRPARRAGATAIAVLGAVAAALLVLLHAQYANAYHYVGAALSSPFTQVHFTAAWAAEGNDVSSFAQQVAIGPGGPLKPLLTAIILAVAAGAVVLSVAGRDPWPARARYLPWLAGAGIIVTAVWFELEVAMNGRYLLGLWMPVTLLVARALGSPTAGRLGAAGLIILCTTWMVAAVVGAADPRYAVAENLHGAATAVGAARAPTLIAIDDAWDLTPLEVYRPSARVPTTRTVAVREIDAIVMPSKGLGFPWGVDHPQPAAQAPRRLPTGFQLVAIVKGSGFIVERFRAPAPVRVEIDSANGPFGGAWRYLLERPGTAGERP